MNKKLVLIVAIGMVLGGCWKKWAAQKAVSEDAALVQSMNSDMFKTVDNEAKAGDYSGTIGKMQGTVSYQSTLDTCATITLNTNGGNFPMTLIIDFGAGCTDQYGITRKGKLTCEFSGRWRDQGTVVTVTPDNYYINNHKIEGLKTVTNQGKNSSNQTYFSVLDQNGKITKPDGGVCTWTANYTQTWIAGENTTSIFEICDDTYALEGTVNGIASTGDTYEYRSVTPIIKKACCYWLSGGVLDVYVNSEKIASVDYGSGNCDATATVTYGGRNYVIVMQ